MIKAAIRLLLIIVSFGLFNYFVNAQQFKDVKEAVEALENKDSTIKYAAADYLAGNQKESIPILKKIVENKQNGWITAIWALTQTKHESVLPFYSKLLEENFYSKDKNGERIIYGLGSPHGCLSFPNQYGVVLAYNLGVIGDERAVPVLREALKQGDKELKEQAYFALYKLKDISLEDFFAIAGTVKEVKIVSLISRVGWENIHSNTNFAIEIFDRIIREFPQERYEVASAHFWKIQCFELLKQYDKALQECDEVLKFSDFENLTKQVKPKKEELLLQVKSLKKS